MSVWRPNAWSNVDEIWYIAATQWNSLAITWPNIYKKINFKMEDGRHIGKCWKCYNSPTNRPIWTKRGWSHAIISLTCSPWWGCHSNGCCLATAHWTFSSYGRLEAERVNQFWLNFCTQQQIWNPMTVTWPNMIFFKNSRWLFGRLD